MAKKQNKKIPPVILLLIYACLLFAIYKPEHSCPGFWGQTIMGTVDTYHNRLDNTDGEMNRSRTISALLLQDGKEYRGHVMAQR